jgi:hypothetical protein
MDINTVDPPVRTKLQPEWKNEPSVKDLKLDYTAAYEYHSEIEADIDEYEKYLDGGPTVKVPKNKSKLRPKLIRKQAEWKYPALEEPFLNTVDMFKVRPRTWEDVQKAEKNMTVLNWQWDNQIDKVKLVNEIVRDFVDLGTVIVKTGWETETTTQEYEMEKVEYATPEQSYEMVERMVRAGKLTAEKAQAILETGEPIVVAKKKVKIQKEVLSKNQPVYEVCNPKNVIIDPTCKGNLSDARFVIY